MPSTLSTVGITSSEILTQITGRAVQTDQLTPRLLFLSGMATVLVGTIYADGQLADQEKHYLQKVLKHFVTSDSSFSQMISLMVRGIRKNRTYANQSALTCLTQTLSESERLLILGLGCRLALADGEVEQRELAYLRQAAIALNISDNYVIALLTNPATDTPDVAASVFDELHCLLDPQRFQNIDPTIVNAASFIRSKLPQQVKPEVSKVRHQSSYEKFEKFEEFRGQLSLICDDLVGIVKTEEGQDLL